ncbi:MAG: hypothetical protein K8T90_12970 [Planctomycetes bacterium]|nr:hypothetical protein [Planctomycetota bacterium]
MLLRSLKLVHFIGVPDLQVRDLRDGAQPIAVPPGVPSRVVLDALRFAFLGRVPAAGNVITEGQGYTWVEAGFRSTDGATASIFRGMDRRGAPHVSLREDGSMRITSDPRDVVSRLEDLLGAPADAVDASTFLCTDVDPASIWPEPTTAPVAVPASEAPTVVLSGAGLAALVRAAPAPPPAVDIQAVEAARRAADDSVEALRRSIRGRQLRDRAGCDHDELLSVGARLRRDRTDVAIAVDKVVADRERVRLRLRRVNEYRDLAAEARMSPGGASSVAASSAAESPRGQQVAVEPRWRTTTRPSGPSRIVEWGLGLCAVGLLALLVIPATAGYVRNDEFGRAAAGLGLIVASGSYLYVASRRHHSGRFVTSVDVSGDPSVDGVRRSAAPHRVAADVGAREALRARFADLGDPDAPGLVDDLRARLAAFDEQASPLQRRLERIDDALSLLDVEAGRAARSLHRPMPPKDEAPAGFGPDADVDAIETRIANLGDSVHQASVERDALVAQGATAPVEASRTLEESFSRLSSACGGDPTLHDALARERVNADQIDSLSAETDVDAVVAKLRGDADAAAQRAVARAASAKSEEAKCAADVTASVAALSGGVTMPIAGAMQGSGLSALMSPVVGSLTGGRFDTVRVVGGALELSGTAGTSRWADLDGPTRARVALAACLRSGEVALGTESAGGGTPRAVVLEAWPEGFSSEGELAAFATEHAPRVTQLIYGRATATLGAVTTAIDARETAAPMGAKPASARGGDSPRRGDRRRP